MSGASATVSVAPAVSAPPTASPPPTGSAGQPGPVQSFTELLSAQRAESRHDEGERHDADEKRGSSHGSKEASAHGPQTSTTSASVPPAGSPAEAPDSGLAESVAVTAGPVAGVAVADASTAAPEGSAVDGLPAPPLERVVPAGVTTTQPAVLPGATTTSTDASSPEAVVAAPDAAVAAAIGQAVPGGRSRDGADETSGPSVPVDPTSAGSGATAPTVAKSPSDAGRVAAPTHSGPAAELAADHVAAAPVEVARIAGSTATPAPVAHAESQNAAAQSEALRAAPSVLRVGEPTAPSASSVNQQAVTTLDVDGLSGSISRPLSDGDGTYTVTVALHPAELGHLQAVMSLVGNDLQVSLTAQTQTGHDALANATEALKDQLGRGGVNVNVTLRDPGSSSGGEERYRPPSTARAGSLMTGSSTAESPVPSGPVAGQIHLVL
jgi:flagellar hook-length control protein FliK